MKRIRLIAILISAILAAASLYFRSAQITLSVIAGSAIVVGSFELLSLIIGRAMGRENKSPAVFIIAAFFKLTLLGLVLWFVVVHTPIHMLAFLVGLSTIVLSVAISGISNAKS